MEKIKITQEQADAIERWADKDQLLIARATGLLNHGEDESIAELEINTLAKALYFGYEVEPEFKTFEEAMKALKEGKCVFFHDGDWKGRILYGQWIEDSEVSGYTFAQLICGKWTIEE